MDQGAPSARGADVRMRPPAVHRPRRPSEFFTRAKSNRLRRGPHDSGMTGPVWPARSSRVGVRGVCSVVRPGVRANRPGSGADTVHRSGLRQLPDHSSK
jgi:hypothetical protein